MSSPRHGGVTGVLSRQHLLSLYLPALIMSLGTGIIAPVLPAFARSFGVDFVVAAQVLFVHQAGALVVVAPIGYLIDRVGRRPLLLAGPPLLGVCAAATGLAGSFPELLLYRFLAGAANQLWWEARLAIIADTAEPNQRARLITWMVGLQRAGMLLGPLLGGFLAAWLGLRWPFFLYGLLTALAVIPSVRLVKETAPHLVTRAEPSGAVTLPEPVEGPEGGSPWPEAVPEALEGLEGRRDAAAPAVAQPSNLGGWRPVLSVLLTLQMMTFLCVQFFATVCRGGLESGTLNLYAVYAYNTPPHVLGLLSTAAAMVTLPIPFITGHLMDRHGRKSIVVPGFATFAASLVAMAASAFLALPFEGYVAAYLLVNATVSVTSGTMQVLGADLAPAFARGRFFSIWRLVSSSGSALSPVLFAAVAGGISYGAAFLTFSAAALAVALLVGIVLTETGRPSHG